MAAFTTLLALGVCIYLHNMAFVVFLVFFVITLTLCLCSVRRIRMFKCLASCGIFPQWCKEKAIECGQSHRMAYFAHGGEKEPELTRIIEVFDLNELSRHITFVHFSPEACDECVSAENLKAAVEVVRCSWPEFRIDVMLVKMTDEGDVSEEEPNPEEADQAQAQASGATPDKQTTETAKPAEVSESVSFTNKLTPKAIQYICEKLRLRTNDLIMGNPGKGTPWMKNLMGVRIMTT